MGENTFHAKIIIIFLLVAQELFLLVRAKIIIFLLIA